MNQLAEHRPTIPAPPIAQSFGSRMIIADRQWGEFIAEIRAAGASVKRSPVSGAIYLLLAQRFLAALIKDESLRKRVSDDLEQQLRDETPPKPGQLI